MIGLRSLINLCVSLSGFGKHRKCLLAGLELFAGPCPRLVATGADTAFRRLLNFRGIVGLRLFRGLGRQGACRERDHDEKGTAGWNGYVHLGGCAAR